MWDEGSTKAHSMPRVKLTKSAIDALPVTLVGYSLLGRRFPRVRR